MIMTSNRVRAVISEAAERFRCSLGFLRARYRQIKAALPRDNSHNNEAAEDDNEPACGDDATLRQRRAPDWEDVSQTPRASEPSEDECEASEREDTQAEAPRGIAAPEAINVTNSAMDRPTTGWRR